MISKEKIPTALTLSRVVLLLPLIFFLLHDMVWAGFTLFCALLITDFFDGFLARAWNVTSSLGAFLDPLADKFLVVSTLFCLTMKGAMPGTWVLAPIFILIREIWVPALRGYLGEEANVIAVSKLGKWKTAFQMIAIAGLILSQIYPILQTPSLITLGIAAALTVISGLDYTKKAWHFLK